MVEIHNDRKATSVDLDRILVYNFAPDVRQGFVTTSQNVERLRFQRAGDGLAPLPR